MLTKRRAHTTLGNGQLPSNMIDADPPTRRAYQFPDAASLRISWTPPRTLPSGAAGSERVICGGLSDQDFGVFVWSAIEA